MTQLFDRMRSGLICRDNSCDLDVPEAQRRTGLR